MAVDHAQVFQGLGVAVELMGGGEGVKVEVRPMLELGLQRGPLPLEQALRLHILLADLGLALDDDRDPHLRLRHVQLGLQAPGLFQRDLQGLGVVVLHDAPVDVQDAGVELGVDHAEVAQAGALVLALLPVVEPDDQIVVDFLQFSHSACPSFLCALPSSGRVGLPPATPSRAFRLIRFWAPGRPARQLAAPSPRPGPSLRGSGRRSP